MLIVEDKRELFDAIFPFPVPTTRLLAEAQDSYMKVFDAVNPQLVIEGADGVENGLLAHLEAIKEPDFWPNESIPALVESHEDLLLIDLKSGIGGKSLPYISRLAMDSVLSLELNPDATATHVMYRAADGAIVVVDDNSYRVIEKKDGVDTITGTFVHGLGRCPARKLWDEMVPNHAIASVSIIDEILGELDLYAAFHVFYDMFKLYGAFPIYYGAESNQEQPTAPNEVPRNQDGSVDAGFVGACDPASKRAGNSFVAPGEFYSVPPGGDLSVAPVGIVEPSTDTLTFHAGDREQMYQKALQYLTGSGGESMLLNQQINKTQATGVFKTKENILLHLSRHLSSAREWGIQTIGELMFRNRLKKVKHSFGTEFYLQTEKELWEGMTAAKIAGASQTILFEKMQSIQAFRLRSGGNKTRSQILMDLEPLREQSTTDLMPLVAAGVVPREKLAVKAQFTDLIAEIERTFGVDVTQIGAAFPYPVQIEKLNQFLYSHVKVGQPEPASPGASGNNTNHASPGASGNNTNHASPGASGNSGPTSGK